MTDKITVLHVVKWFYAGGAERLLSSLLQHSDREHYEHVVLSLSDEGERIQAVEHELGVAYYAIPIWRTGANWRGYLQCLRLMRRLKPDVVKGWLPPGNMTGGIIARLLGIPVIWGIHDAQPAHTHSRKQFWLSRFVPRRVVCCSEPVRSVCLEVGYNPKLMEVIVNGTDTARFCRDAAAGERVRASLGIPLDGWVIGMAAECTTIKRHRYVLNAVQVFAAHYPDVHVILCGKDVLAEHWILAELLQDPLLKGRVHCLGVRNDMPALYSAMDVHVLVSQCESFGLANSEAMACETLCVATDVGLMQALLDEVGFVIPVTDDVEPLVRAWEACRTMDAATKRKRLQRGRQRVVEEYSIEQVARRYDALYASVARY